MAPLKPEWCARGQRRQQIALECRRPPASKENRYKPKTKSVVDCGRPKTMDAPRRRASRLRMLGVKPVQRGVNRPGAPPGRRAKSAGARATAGRHPVSRRRAGEKRPSHKSGSGSRRPSTRGATCRGGCDSWLDAWTGATRRKGVIVGPVAGVRVWRRVGRDSK